MGHKTNPVGYRLILNRNWQSRWFARKDYAKKLLEDQKIKKLIMNLFGSQALIGRVEIERSIKEVSIIIFTARPGIIIGRSGQGLQELRNKIALAINGKIKIEVMEIKDPDLSASVMGQVIAQQIVKRIAYRRAVKQSLEKIMTKKALGARITVSGRLGGVDIARTEKFTDGFVPLSTLKANIDYAQINALTTYGIVGVKVWINLPIKSEEE